MSSEPSGEPTPEPEPAPSPEPGAAAPPERTTAAGAGDPELVAAFAAPRKLHVAAAVVGGLAALRGLAFPLIAILFLGGSTGGMGQALIGAAVGGVLSLGLGFVSWNATSYQLTGGSLRFRSGAFSPDETLIPVTRIQGVDTVQGPVQRLFGVVELHVQTPGGGSSGEIVLSAIEPADARALRAALGHDEPQSTGVRRSLSRRGLVVAALTAPQFGVVLPLVGAAFAGASDLFGNDVGESLLERIDTPPEAIRAALIVLAATLLISFLAGVIAFAGFEVERDGDRLRIRRGLFQRRAASVPVARVDGVAIVEGLLRAPFGLATVRLETAGYRAEQSAAKTLIPLIRTTEIPALLAELLPGLDGAEPARLATAGPTASEAARIASPEADAASDGSGPHAGAAAAGSRPHAEGGPVAGLAYRALQRPPRRSLRRYLAPPALAAAGLGLVIAVAAGLGGWWWLAPLLAAAGALDGLLDFRAAGLALEPDRVVLRARQGTARVTLMARRGRLQEMGVSRNPLQRHARLATFELALGSGRRGRVRHLEAETADGTLAALRP